MASIPPESVKLQASWDPILILEDEVWPGIEIRKHFAQSGYRTELCSDLNQATEAVTNRPVAAIIADVHIMDESSVEFVRMTRQRQPWVFIVGISGFFGTAAVKEIKLVCDAFFDKPVDIEYLEKTVEEGVSHRRSDLTKWCITSKLLGTDSPSYRVTPPGPAIVDASNDPNFLAYKNMEEELKRHYLGQYVAFVHGKLVDHDTDRERLISRVYHEHGETNMLVQKVQEELKVVRFRRPRRVLSSNV